MLETQFVSPLRERLRAATKAAHHRIDHHPLLAPLVSPQLSLEHYQRILQTLFWFHDPLQATLEVACAHFQGSESFPPSDRRTWLLQDLNFFKVEPIVEGHPLTDWRGPALSANAELVGALYVVEGSTLGGQVIARQLQENFGYRAVSGARLFNGHGVNTMLRWNNFWRYADLCPEHEWRLAEAKAVEVFDALFDALEKAAAYWGRMSS
jgi:heme oxygenase (biliverdin-IX-beta and delta-forming)